MGFCVPMLRPRVTDREDDETVTETTPFLPAGQNQHRAGRQAHVVKAVLYGLQNFYAFMLM